MKFVSVPAMKNWKPCFWNRLICLRCAGRAGPGTCRFFSPAATILAIAFIEPRMVLVAAQPQRKGEVTRADEQHVNPRARRQSHQYVTTPSVFSTTATTSTFWSAKS